MPRPPSPQRPLTAAEVFVGFVALYLATMGLGTPKGDAAPMWDAACNLARHGTLAIDLRWPVNAPVGRGGHFYPVSALLAVLVHLPGALLQRLLAALAPSFADNGLFFTAQIGPLVLGALTPALFYRLLQQNGYSARAALWAALLLGIGTPIWVYAHRPYSEMVQAACFVVFLGTLLRAGEAPSGGAFARWGLAAALLVNAKNIYFVCLPGAVVYLVWRLRARRALLRPGLVGAAVGFAPGVIALGLYDLARWGSPFSSGYGAVTAGFWRENVFFGLWGQFFSPGRSLFLFAPVMVLSLFGIRRLLANRRHVALATALVVGPVVLVYARYLFWSGDWGWGPRYLVFAMPAFLIPAAELFDESARAGPAGRRHPPPARAIAGPAAGLLVMAGVGVQLLGTAFYWDDYIDLARQAQVGWLGSPNLTGSPLAPYPCFSCLEEVYGVQWLPALQPIEGHWWLLRHKVRGDDWRTAASDAPWTRYTSLTLDIARPYDRAQIDWWPLLAPPGRRAPVIVACLFLLAGVVPARRWRAALRPAEPPPSDPPRATT